jgi:hypothetical protein
MFSLFYRKKDPAAFPRPYNKWHLEFESSHFCPKACAVSIITRSF